jgi:excisionase family DNA binding protein
MSHEPSAGAPKSLLDRHEALTVPEACNVLRISRPTLYRHVAAGKLTALKVGARTLFRSDEVRRFINADPVGGHHVAA